MYNLTAYNGTRITGTGSILALQSLALSKGASSFVIYLQGRVVYAQEV